MQRMREIQGMINRGIIPEGYPYYGGVPPGAPMHPQFGAQGQPYMPQAHPGQVPRRFQAWFLSDPGRWLLTKNRIEIAETITTNNSRS